MKSIEKNLGLLILIFLSTLSIIRGQTQIDSLLKIDVSNFPDSAKLEHYFNIAEDYHIFYEDKHTEALAYCDSIITLGSRINDTGWTVSGYNLKGRIYNSIEKLEAASENFRFAMAKSLESGDSLRYAQIMDNYAYVLVDQGNFDEAIDSKLKALEVFKKADNKRSLSICMFGIGWIYMEREMFEKAIPWFYQTLELQKEWPLFMAEVYGNLAIIYRQTGNVDSAQICFRKTALYGKEVPGTIALNLHEFAQFKMQIGQPDSAVFLIRQLLNMEGQETHGELYHQYRLFYAKALARVGKVGEAVKELQALTPVLSESENLDYQKNYYAVGQEIYEESGNYRQSLIYHKHFTRLKDSIQNVAAQARFKEIETKFETTKKNQEIADLAHADTLNQARLSNQRNWIIGLVLGVGSLLYLLYRINTQKRKIDAQRTDIAKALEDKNILLKEIHHRVKNNLQVVSSLLGLQSRFVDDNAALEAIKTGRSRVQSMSLLHQNLYKNENLKSIQIKKYFEDLGRNLFDTYQLNERNIEFEADIDDLELDIDVVVPMGLITNELVSNALKHAFTTEDAGRIFLSIKQDNNHISLTVADNGKGIQSTILPERSNSLGLQLIKSFSEKLNAKIDISNVQGTIFKISFRPEYLINSAA